MQRSGTALRRVGRSRGSGARVSGVAGPGGGTLAFLREAGRGAKRERGEQERIEQENGEVWAMTSNLDSRLRGNDVCSQRRGTGRVESRELSRRAEWKRTLVPSPVPYVFRSGGG